MVTYSTLSKRQKKTAAVIALYTHSLVATLSGFDDRGRANKRLLLTAASHEAGSPGGTSPAALCRLRQSTE